MRTQRNRPRRGYSAPEHHSADYASSDRDVPPLAQSDLTDLVARLEAREKKVNEGLRRIEVHRKRLRRAAAEVLKKERAVQKLSSEVAKREEALHAESSHLHHDVSLAADAAKHEIEREHARLERELASLRQTEQRAAEDAAQSREKAETYHHEVLAYSTKHAELLSEHAALGEEHEQVTSTLSSLSRTLKESRAVMLGLDKQLRGVRFPATAPSGGGGGAPPPQEELVWTEAPRSADVEVNLRTQQLVDAAAILAKVVAHRVGNAEDAARRIMRDVDHVTSELAAVAEERAAAESAGVRAMEMAAAQQTTQHSFEQAFIQASETHDRAAEHLEHEHTVLINKEILIRREEDELRARHTAALANAEALRAREVRVAQVEREARADLERRAEALRAQSVQHETDAAAAMAAIAASKNAIRNATQSEALAAERSAAAERAVQRHETQLAEIAQRTDESDRRETTLRAQKEELRNLEGAMERSARALATREAQLLAKNASVAAKLQRVERMASTLTEREQKVRDAYDASESRMQQHETEWGRSRREEAATHARLLSEVHAERIAANAAVETCRRKSEAATHATMALDSAKAEHAVVEAQCARARATEGDIVVERARVTKLQEALLTKERNVSKLETQVRERELAAMDALRSGELEIQRREMESRDEVQRYESASRRERDAMLMADRKRHDESLADLESMKLAAERSMMAAMAQENAVARGKHDLALSSSALSSKDARMAQLNRVIQKREHMLAELADDANQAALKLKDEQDGIARRAAALDDEMEEVRKAKQKLDVSQFEWESEKRSASSALKSGRAEYQRALKDLNAQKRKADDHEVALQVKSTALLKGREEEAQAKIGVAASARALEAQQLAVNSLQQELQLAIREVKEVEAREATWLADTTRKDRARALRMSKLVATLSRRKEQVDRDKATVDRRMQALSALEDGAAARANEVRAMQSDLDTREVALREEATRQALQAAELVGIREERESVDTDLVRIEAQRETLGAQAESLAQSRDELDRQESVHQAQALVLAEQRGTLAASEAAAAAQQLRITATEAKLDQMSLEMAAEQASLQTDRARHDDAHARFITARDTFERTATEEKDVFEAQIAELTRHESAVVVLSEDAARRDHETKIALEAAEKEQRELKEKRVALRDEQSELALQQQDLVHRAAAAERAQAAALRDLDDRKAILQKRQQTTLADSEHAETLRAEVTAEHTALICNENALMLRLSEFKAHEEALNAQKADLALIRQRTDAQEIALETGLREVSRGENALRDKRSELAAHFTELTATRVELSEQQQVARVLETEARNATSSIAVERAELKARQAAVEAERAALVRQASRVAEQRTDLEQQQEQYRAQLAQVRESGREIEVNRVENLNQSAKLVARATALASREIEFEVRHVESDALRVTLEERLRLVATQSDSELAAQREAEERAERSTRAMVDLEHAREILDRDRAALAHDEISVEAARHKLAEDENRALILERKATLELETLQSTAAEFEEKELHIAGERRELEERASNLAKDKSAAEALAARAEQEQRRNEDMAAMQLREMHHAKSETGAIAQAKERLESESRAAAIVQQRQAEEAIAQRERESELDRLTRALRERVGQLDQRQREVATQRAEIEEARRKIQVTQEQQREQVEVIKEHIAANHRQKDIARDEKERVERVRDDCARQASALAQAEASLHERESELKRKDVQLDDLRESVEAQRRELADGQAELRVQAAAMAAQRVQIETQQHEVEVELEHATTNRRSLMQLEESAADVNEVKLVLEARVARLEAEVRESRSAHARGEADASAWLAGSTDKAVQTALARAKMLYDAEKRDVEMSAEFEARTLEANARTGMKQLEYELQAARDAQEATRRDAELLGVEVERLQQHHRESDTRLQTVVASDRERMRALEEELRVRVGELHDATAAAQRGQQSQAWSGSGPAQHELQQLEAHKLQSSARDAAEDEEASAQLIDLLKQQLTEQAAELDIARLEAEQGEDSMAQLTVLEQALELEKEIAMTSVAELEAVEKATFESRQEWEEREREMASEAASLRRTVEEADATLATTEAAAQAEKCALQEVLLEVSALRKAVSASAAKLASAEAEADAMKAEAAAANAAIAASAPPSSRTGSDAKAVAATSLSRRDIEVQEVELELRARVEALRIELATAQREKQTLAHEAINVARAKETLTLRNLDLQAANRDVAPDTERETRLEEMWASVTREKDEIAQQWQELHIREAKVQVREEDLSARERALVGTEEEFASASSSRGRAQGDAAPARPGLPRRRKVDVANAGTWTDDAAAMVAKENAEEGAISAHDLLDALRGAKERTQRKLAILADVVPPPPEAETLSANATELDECIVELSELSSTRGGEGEGASIRLPALTRRAMDCIALEQGTTIDISRIVSSGRSRPPAGLGGRRRHALEARAAACRVPPTTVPDEFEFSRDLEDARRTASRRSGDSRLTRAIEKGRRSHSAANDDLRDDTDSLDGGDDDGASIASAYSAASSAAYSAASNRSGTSSSSTALSRAARSPLPLTRAFGGGGGGGGSSSSGMKLGGATASSRREELEEFRREVRRSRDVETQREYAEEAMEGNQSALLDFDQIYAAGADRSFRMLDASSGGGGGGGSGGSSRQQNSSGPVVHVNRHGSIDIQPIQNAMTLDELEAEETRGGGFEASRGQRRRQRGGR